MVLRKQLQATNEESDPKLNTICEMKTLTVTAGPELYSPISYNTFTIGPVVVTITVEKNETWEAAHDRGYAIANAILARQFKAAIQHHLERRKESKS